MKCSEIKSGFLWWKAGN